MSKNLKHVPADHRSWALGRGLLPIMVLAVCAAPMAARNVAAQPAAPLTAETFRSGVTSDLGRLCAPDAQDPARLAALGYCHGFLVAIGQVHLELSREDGPFRPFFCLPEPRPAVADVGARFAEWSRAHPQHGAEPSAEGVLRFATATYPCAAQPAAPSRPSRSR